MDPYSSIISTTDDAWADRRKERHQRTIIGGRAARQPPPTQYHENRPLVNKISSNHFLRLAIRCLILVMVLISSTGPLIRRLFFLTLRHSLAILLGSLWLAGDLLPSVALFVVMKRILLDIELSSISKLSHITFLHFSILVSVALYSTELIAYIYCTRIASANCEENLVTFRYIFFHIQALLAILDLLKPWNWSNIDLRDILTRFERLHSLCLRVTCGLLSLLNRTTRSPHQLNQREHQLVSGVTTERQETSTSASLAAITSNSSRSADDNVSAATVSFRNSKQVQDESTEPVASTRSSRPRSRVQKLSSSTMTNRRQTRTTSRADSRRTTRAMTRSTSRSKTASQRQPIRQTITIVRRASSERRSTRRISGRAANVLDEQGSRTVNVNLNVN